MNTLSQHEVWEEILFGNTNRYRLIVDQFADTAEYLATSTAKPHASEVVRCILDGNGPENPMSLPVAEDLLRGAFTETRGNRYGFREWLKTELARLIDDCPDGLVEEVVEVIPDDLEQPNELPVVWPDE